MSTTSTPSRPARPARITPQRTPISLRQSVMSNSTRSSSSSLTLPDVTPEGNPGMTSGEDTPNSSYPDALPDGVHVLTPPPKNAPEIEILDADRTYPPELAARDDLITKKDVAADPILNDLADSQDSNFRYSGLGPRLSKSAALRMKLKWEDPRDVRRVSGEEVPVNFANVPGHKRSGLDLNVSSLAEPSVAPRTNRAALLRSGQDAPAAETKDRAEIAALNKARDAAERAERRKTLPRPTSLLLPSQIPRQNRAALLRAGQAPPEEPPKRDAREMAENAVRNKARDQAEYAERRRTIQVPASLSAPVIPPRANRASMLRTNTGDATTLASPPPRPPRSHMRTASSVSNRSSTNGGSSFKTAGDRALAGKIEAANAAAEKAERAEAERKEKMARRRQTMAAMPSGEAAGPAALTYNEEKAAAERAALRRIAAKREEEARKAAEKAAQDRADRERIEKRRSMTLGRATGLTAAHAIKEVPEPAPEPEETEEEKEARERVFRRQTFGTAPPSLAPPPRPVSTSPTPSNPPSTAAATAGPALRSLGAPLIPPRPNRASMLRENGLALSRISSKSSNAPSTRSRSGSLAASERSDAGIKTSSPKKRTSTIPAQMTTPSRFIAPRPAPAPPRARPVSSISFALPEIKREEKKSGGLFGRLLKPSRQSVIGAPASRPGLGNKRGSIISSPSPQL